MTEAAQFIQLTVHTEINNLRQEFELLSMEIRFLRQENKTLRMELAVLRGDMSGLRRRLDLQAKL